ncbi:MAG: hypothetical protein ACOCZK_05910 [Planctomycetota bacterium]
MEDDPAKRLDDYVAKQIDPHILTMLALKYKTSETSIRRMVEAYVKNYDPLYLTMKHEHGQIDMDDTTSIRVGIEALLRDARIFDQQLRQLFGEIIWDYQLMHQLKKVERMVTT